MTHASTQASWRWLAGALATLALAGCAAVTATTPEAAVRERAVGHWKARLANDTERSYAFMPPSYRALKSLESYKKSFGDVQLTSAQVERVTCETADKCVATAKIEAKVALRRANTAPIVTYYDETWIREDGQWWLFPSQ
jgi:hypothetical protein